MCLYPKLIKNRKYIANKKNGGNIPPVTDLRVLMVPVGCGKCIECKKQKSREWSIRLQEEIRHINNGKFVTLTFSEESLVEQPVIKKMSKKLKKQQYKFYLIISIFSPIFNLLLLFLLSILSFFTLTLYFFAIASVVS